MGHKRVKMELIEKSKNRMITFKKRKPNLLRKTSEFSILCNVSACVIIFPPKLDGKPAKPETWPSNSNEVLSIIDKYKASEQRKNNNVADYFREKKRKIELELEKLHSQRRKAKYPTWDRRLDNVPEYQLRFLLAELATKIESVDRKIGMMKKNVMSNVGPEALNLGDQISQHLSYDLKQLQRRLNNDFLYLNDLQVVSKMGATRCFPEFNSQLGMPNQNLVQGSDNNFGYSTNFSSHENSFNFPLPIDFQLKQEGSTSMQMWNNQNPNGNNQFMPLEELPYVDNSEYWIGDNVMSNGAYSPTNFASPMLQPCQSQVQFLTSGLPYPLQSSQISDFNNGIESQRKESNHGF